MALLFLVAARPACAIVGPSTDGSALAPVVLMVLNRAGRAAGFCSGIVIGPRVVLTAAHCVPSGGDVRIHFRDDAGRPMLLPIAEVVRHPGYRADAVRQRQRSIDLALVRLPENLPARFGIAKLSDGGGLMLGTRVRVAGYGVGQEGEGASSGKLRVGLIEVEAPASSLLLWGRDPDRRGTGACEGDSGGPVLAEGADEVVGLTLWAAGEGSRRCGALTQALWLGPYRAWIDGTLRGWAAGR